MRTVRFRDPAGNVRRGEWSGQPDDEIAVRSHYGGRVAIGTETLHPDDVTVLAPCDPSKIVCALPNAAAETEDRSAASRPELFLKPPSAVASHRETIELPHGTERITCEPAVGAVISEHCTSVHAATVEDVIAGYTCLTDLTNHTERGRERELVRAKAFDGAAPIGPVVSRPENVRSGAQISLSVNDSVACTTTVDQLTFSFGVLIEEITRHLSLQPGDIVATGTGEAVDSVSGGDTLALEIDGIGRLVHDIATR